MASCTILPGLVIGKGVERGWQRVIESCIEAVIGNSRQNGTKRVRENSRGKEVKRVIGKGVERG